MSELTLWPQVLFVLLSDPHNKNVFLKKPYSLSMQENQKPLPSVTLIHQLCSKRKPIPQHTKWRGTRECLALISPDFYVNLHITLLFPRDRALSHLDQLCLISQAWLLHHCLSGATCLRSALNDDFFLPCLCPAKHLRKWCSALLLLVYGHSALLLLSKEGVSGKDPMP